MIEIRYLIEGLRIKLRKFFKMYNKLEIKNVKYVKF